MPFSEARPIVTRLSLISNTSPDSSPVASPLPRATSQALYFSSAGSGASAVPIASRLMTMVPPGGTLPPRTPLAGASRSEIRCGVLAGAGLEGASTGDGDACDCWAPTVWSTITAEVCGAATEASGCLTSGLVACSATGVEAELEGAAGGGGVGVAVPSGRTTLEGATLP